jgi:hypothetical protein
MKIEVRIPCCPKCAMRWLGRNSLVWVLALATLAGLGALRALRWLNGDNYYSSVGKDDR